MQSLIEDLEHALSCFVDAMDCDEDELPQGHPGIDAYMNMVVRPRAVEAINLYDSYSKMGWFRRLLYRIVFRVKRDIIPIEKYKADEDLKPRKGLLPKRSEIL